jgi:hypothetical protein
VAPAPQLQARDLTTRSARGNVRFAIGIKPKVKTGRITLQYVSPSTQSMQILTDGANPVVVNLTPSSPNCSPNPTVSGAFICTASLNVQAGNHVFTVTAYDLNGATGNVLSTNSTGKIFVKPTGTTTVSLVLEGGVRYVILTLTTVYPTIGKPAAIGLTPILQDFDQNLIVRSGALRVSSHPNDERFEERPTFKDEAELAGRRFRNYRELQRREGREHHLFCDGNGSGTGERHRLRTDVVPGQRFTAPLCRE